MHPGKGLLGSMLNSNSGKFPKFLAEMCKICTREDFISLLDAGCWLLAVGWLHPQRLLGTGMQSICKFSLLCRVCKCSSIWLLSIFSLSVAGCRLPVTGSTPSPVCHLRVFCVISTLESASNVVCLSGLSDRKGGRPCLALFLLSRQPPLGYANDAWLPLGSWRMR